MLRPLGSGGMSTVYLARQISLDRKVAIKVMKRVGDSSSPDAQQFERRFLLEGRTMAMLPHRNIVAVYDIVTNDDIAYIVMEYIDGGTLSERMLAGVSLGDALAVVVQTAGALEFAHSRGVVHRDLKATNIMYRGRNVPVLTDFGIARQRDSESTALTQAGMMVGTPQYMSPEQINGIAVDGRADQYALGVLFYELLAGTQPFTGDSALAVLMAHLSKEPPPLPAEFVAFQDVVHRMLAKDREQRYPNLDECVADIKLRLTQSNTLLTRLQLNSDQSASDQLIDLGFNPNTPSGFNTGGSMPSLAPGPRGLRRLDAIRQSRWGMAAAAAGAALVLVLGLWLAFGHKHELTQDERDLVSIWLERAEQRIKSNQLLGGNSAYEYLQKVLQKDSKNGQAGKLLDEIAANLGTSAQAAFTDGKFDQALELSSEALLVRPENADVAAIKTKVVQAQKAALQKQQIADLLDKAESARINGRIFGDKSAYASLIEARTLAPSDADVAQRIDSLIKNELAKAQKSLDAGEFSATTNTLANLEPYLESEPAFAELKSKLISALSKQQIDGEIASLSVRATAQLRTGKLTAPMGDNASESLGELRKLAAQDPRTADLGKALGKALLAEAKRQDAANQPNLAIDSVELALQADPQAADAEQFKTQIQRRLGQRATDIARALSIAQAALNEQRFVAPARDDAHTALESLLKLDPENASGKQLLAELPKRIAAATQTNSAKDPAGASALVEAALKIYPQDPALTQLQVGLSAQLARESAEKALQTRRDRIASLLSAPSADLQQLKSAAQELDTLFAASDASDETRKLRARLITQIGNRIRNADATADFDATAAILNDAKKTLSGDASYATLVAALPDLRAKTTAAEQARVEAERGELVLNAFPWGKVESVVDANQKAVSLPQDTVTPLTLALPAGSYIITFRHPQAAQATKVIAKVEAKKRNIYNASFPTISAKGYFSRAGW